MHGISTAAGRMATALCLMLAVGEAAAARDAGTDTRSVKVSLRGIDLATIAGREQARQHVAYVVRREYGLSGSGSVIPPADAAASEDAAMATAMSGLQRLEAAATGRDPFRIAAVTPRR